MQQAKRQLQEGEAIPFIGFGTGVVRKYSRNPILFFKTRLRAALSSIKHMRWSAMLKQDLYMERFVLQAIQEEYRLFDCGRIYGYSEVMVGRAAARSGIAREQFFLTTKISDMDLEREGSPHDVRGNLMDSLQYLRTSYIDAYLLHWPHGDWLDIYQQMEQVHKEGLARHIGVCNFKVEHLEQLKQHTEIPPSFCQVELHPLNSKKALRRYCKENGILVMAHTPTGRMCEKIRNHPVLQELALAHKKTVAQIILRWHYQNEIVPIVATTNPLHMRENTEIFDFELSEAEMERIDSLDEGYVMLPGNGIDDPNYRFNL